MSEGTSVKPKDTANGTQYLIDIQVTVELVGDFIRANAMHVGFVCILSLEDGGALKIGHWKEALSKSYKCTTGHHSSCPLCWGPKVKQQQQQQQ